MANNQRQPFKSEQKRRCKEDTVNEGKVICIFMVDEQLLLLYSIQREWRSCTGQRAATDDSLESKREKKGIILARFKYRS